MLTLNPYLVFNGNCEEAFKLYEQVFNGKILFMGRYKDIPPESRQYFMNAPGEKIMHATLKINANTVLMACDSVEVNAEPKAPATANFYLYISTETEADAYRIFNALAIQGKITMAISQTFWSTHYGMVVDRFGIHWKITSDPNEEK